MLVAAPKISIKHTHVCNLLYVDHRMKHIAKKILICFDTDSHRRDYIQSE